MDGYEFKNKKNQRPPVFYEYILAADINTIVTPKKKIFITDTQ